MLEIGLICFTENLLEKILCAGHIFIYPQSVDKYVDNYVNNCNFYLFSNILEG